MKNYIKILLAYFNSFALYITSLIGKNSREAVILCLMMLLDMLTGLALCFVKKSDKSKGGGFISRSMARGILKKLLILVMLALSSLVDEYFKLNGMLKSLAFGFYITNEALSVIENTARLGVPFPKGIRGMLEAMRTRNDEKTPSENDADKSGK